MGCVSSKRKIQENFRITQILPSRTVLKSEINLKIKILNLKLEKSLTSILEVNCNLEVSGEADEY